jgi:hypothetical protein
MPPPRMRYVCATCRPCGTTAFESAKVVITGAQYIVWAHAWRARERERERERVRWGGVGARHLHHALCAVCCAVQSFCETAASDFTVNIPPLSDQVGSAPFRSDQRAGAIEIDWLGSLRRGFVSYL